MESREASTGTAGQPLLLLPAGDETPGRVLWVGNLDRDVRAAELGALFAPFGTVEGVRVLARKRCGFVTFADAAAAAVARDAVDGHLLAGRPLRVHFGRQRTSAGAPAVTHTTALSREEEREWCAHALSVVVEDDDEEGKEGRTFGCTRAVWVGNVGDDVTDAAFAAFVAQFGRVETTRLLRTKRCGFANYTCAADAARAVHGIAGQRLGAGIVKVNYAQPRTAHHRRRHRRHRKGKEEETSETSETPEVLEPPQK